MSFSNLQNSRKKKESRSFVHSSPSKNKSEGNADGQTENETSNPATEYPGLYEDLPSSLYIRESATSGRGLWSNAPVKPGTIIFSLKPPIIALSNHHLNSHCSFCAEPSPKDGLKRCIRCHTIWYCNPICQKKDWGVHKSECIALQRWKEQAPSPEHTIPSDAIRGLGRVLWRRQKEGPQSSLVKELDLMQSNRRTLPQTSYELHTHLAHSLIRYLSATSPTDLSEYGISSVADLVDLISRFTTNTFTLTSPSLTPLGVSISPLIALINHSCEPNAVIVFPRTSAPSSPNEPSMHVVCLRPIGAGEEILTAYIDTTLPRALRQKSLQETYNFTCRCVLCESKADIDPRLSIRCPKSCGGLCPLPTQDEDIVRCGSCHAIMTSVSAVVDAAQIGQEALDKAAALQYQDPAKATQLTTNTIPILISGGFNSPTHPLLALARLHTSLLISALSENSTNTTQSQLDDTIRAAAQASSGLGEVLYPGHPVRCIAFAELGKLLAVDEPSPITNTLTSTSTSTTTPPTTHTFPPSGPPRLKLARDTLVQARMELLVGFGLKNDGGLVGKEVRETLVAMEKELGVWKQGVRNVVEDMRAGEKGGGVERS